VRCQSCVAAWLNVAGHALRPAARRAVTWQARIGFALLFAFAGGWAAVAPQAGLSLGERLRLSFNALVGLCAIIAATSTLRRQFAIINDPSLNLRWRSRRMAEFVSHAVTALQDLIPAIPFFIFLAALQVISTGELIIAVAEIVLIVVAASAVTNVTVSILLIAAIATAVVTRRFNYFETSIAVLFALHVALKAYVAWAAINSTARLRRNLDDETTTTLEQFEVAALHRRRLWREFVTPVIGLACVNVAFVLMLLWGVAFPATLEQKLALGLTLAGGAALLFVDTSALVWRGALSGLTTRNSRAAYARSLALIVGLPWAVAWVFAALHAGEAFTLNEGAAYFFMWLALSAGISWIARVTAKEKLQRDLRRLLSED
jgi:hypothetical protein